MSDPDHLEIERMLKTCETQFWLCLVSLILVFLFLVGGLINALVS